jgi:hypothetical protein
MATVAPPHRYRGPVLAVAVLAALYGGYIMGSALLARRPAGPRLAAGFVGTRVCAECHAAIARKHGGSHHALALHTAAEFERSVTLPEPAWQRDPQLPVSYQVTKRDGVLGVETQQGAQTLWQPTAWAFGSGNQAMTPVGVRPDGDYVEAPISFYRRAGWDFTPGFVTQPPQRRQANATGTRVTAAEVFDCFHCHAAGVQKTATGLDLSGMQMGIQCERCHGPGAEHVSLARAGRPRGGIQVPGRTPGQTVMQFCGTCHRNDLPQGVHMDNPVVARFAPIGLQQSRCFRESQGALTCITCHDPHANANPDPQSYRAICASCHGEQPHQTVCPVQPKGDCVSCHMPRQIVQRNSIFTDHWIRVVKRLGAARQAAEKVPATRIP